LRDREWETTQVAKREWARKRIGKSVAQVDKFELGDIGDKLMQEYLEKEGLLPMPAEQK
jgi:hypothetical protein